MNWFKKLLAATALVNIAIGPAFAGGLSQQEAYKAAQYKQYLEPMGYKVQIDEGQKRILIFEKENNKASMEIPLAEEAHLQKYSPKNLDRVLLDEMVKVKTAGQAAFSHSLKALPSESMIFFLSMGAVVAGQLIMDYSQNPVAMKHHIDHQTSPVGIFGFYAFMASQGVTANLLAMYTSNPRFHHMIPYLGMTVGAFVQSYLSQVVSDPNVVACGKEMIGKKMSPEALAAVGADADPCAKAYEYLVIKKKIWEYAPGIVSMLMSSVLSGLAESAITGAIFQLTGFDVALWLMPGSMQLKGLRLVLVKGLQIAIFISIDAWLSRKVNAAWKNFFDGAQFIEINSKLNTQVNSLKRNNWNGSAQELHAEIANFRSKMSNWRFMNLAEVYESHQAWQENLHQLISMYNSSYIFYDAFINEIRNVRYNLSYVNPLQITYPLNGVTAKGIQVGREDLYLQSPKMIENWQADTVYDAVDKIDQFTKTSAYQDLLMNEKAVLKKIRNLLNSEDHNQMGQGLDWLNYTMKQNNETLIKSDRFVQFLKELKNSMGHPDPKFELGRGWFASFEIAPSTGDAVKGTPFYRQVGNMHTPTITEHLVMQMICGPDAEKGEALIHTSVGFPAVFTPPQIKSDKDHFGNLCQTLGRPKYSATNIYIWPIDANNKKKYKGFVNYLVDNARESVIGSESESGFKNWWIQKTESQVQQAFAKFAKSYESIVANMMRTVYNQNRKYYSNIFDKTWDKIENKTKTFLDLNIWGSTVQRRDRSTFNRGPISNAAMSAAFQEERAYLSILEDILQPSSQFNLNLENILKVAPSNKDIAVVENEFLKLNQLLRQIKVTVKDGRETIESPLENFQIDEQVERIQLAITDLSNKLGIGEAPLAKSPALTPAQKDIAVLCLQNLQFLSAEISMYGRMANAVSWDKIKNLKQVNIEKNQFNNEMQSKLARMRGLLNSISP